MIVQTLDLCVGIAEYRSPYGRRSRGLCSSFLSKLKKNSKFHCKLEVGLIQLDMTSPVMCVATGTGISPVRSIIQHRYKNDNDRAKNTLLFQGCRLPGKDDLFSSEWDQIADSSFSHYFAYSQLGKVKTYVQHLILKNASTVQDIVKEVSIMIVIVRVIFISTYHRVVLWLFVARQKGCLTMFWMP